MSAATTVRRWSWFVAPRRPSRRPSATGRDRITSLDGLRALGLILVVGFHFGVGGMEGGFFGVDLFYVLSGFLITGLLLGEWAARGRIALGQFWARRARRLLPALLVMVAVVALLLRATEPAGYVPGFRMDAISALFYFSNWWQIHTAGNYFVTTGPVSPLTHTWSLAVEEQFYLVWPLVVLGILGLVRTRRTAVAVVGVLAAGGAAASTALMAIRYAAGTSTTRLYFGTDTHAQSVLVGATLACLLTFVQLRRGEEGMAPPVRSPWCSRLVSAMGLAGLTGLLVFSATTSGLAPFPYRGGFLLVAVASAAVIAAAVTVPSGVLSRLFSLRPLVWLGTISYGAYLWHFPVAVFLDGSRTGLTGVTLLALRVAATLIASTASWVLIERPILEGTFWRQLRSALPALGGLGVTCAVVLATTALPAQASTATPAPPGPSTAPGLPTALRASLLASHAFGAHPVRFMMVGDSLSVTMSMGLGRQSIRSYGVDVIDRGVIGCDLDTAPTTNGVYRIVPKGPCQHWPSLWAHDVAVDHPQVVGLLLSFWTVCDHFVDGRDVHIGQPAWDAHLLAEYRRALHILSRRGARVVLFTSPFFGVPGDQPDGQPLPENQPARVDELNRLLRQVAAGNRNVTIVDLNRLLDPGGRFAPTLDGITMRWSDGIHITVPGGEWLQPRILPTVAALGQGLPVPRDGLPVELAAHPAARRARNP